MSRLQNFPLLLGAILAAFFLLIAILGPALAPNDPYQVFNDPILVGEERYLPAAIPVPPLELPQFQLGTDNAGRDLFSRLLFAVRPTLILGVSIVVVRVAVGLFLGLMAGWYQKRIERVIDSLISVSLAIPLLIFALAALSFLGERGLIHFIIALTLTGWANTAVFIKNRTQTIMQAPFIEGARAVGVKSFDILRRHILPQIWPAVPSLIAFELGSVLLVIAELGFLGMFIGDGLVLTAADPNSAGNITVGLTSTVPELGQMLSDFWSKMIRTPWEIAIVGFVIFLQIFAFNMLGEGLRRRMDLTVPRRFWWRKTAVLPEPKVAQS